MEQKRIGRPPRFGEPTVFVRLRMPESFKARAQEHARARGMSFTDLIGLALERETGLTYLDQEGLPLNEAS